MVLPSGSSRILAPHRAIGLVCDGQTPFALQSLGGEPFVVVSVGHAFQVFSAEHLRVVAVSQRMPRAISALAAHRDRTYVACGRHVSAWERMHPLASIGQHPHGTVVALLTLGGGELLVSLSDHGGIRVWDLKHKSLIGRKHRCADGSIREEHKDVGDDDDHGALEQTDTPLVVAMDDLGEGFENPTAVVHPETYLNKVLVGSASGCLALFNIRSSKRIHLFRSLKTTNSHRSSSQSMAAAMAGTTGRSGGGGSGGGESVPVTALEPSPALDVCAVGMGNGLVHLLHLRQDVILFSLTHASSCPVTALSFRTDGGVWGSSAGGSTTADSAVTTATLVSGQSDGRVWVWGLEDKRVLGEVNFPLGAHGGSSSSDASGKVLSLCFLPREPVLLSLGADNALKAWIFDAKHASGSGTLGKSGAGAGCAGARLLRSREGHAKPPAPRAVRWFHNNAGGSGVLASAGHGDDATALQLLSGGSDRALRSSHAVRDALSCELSQGKVLSKAKRLCVAPSELKLRPVVALATCEARSRDWSDVVSAHEKDSCVYVWRNSAKALGPHELRQPHWPVSNMGSDQNPSHFATSVGISVCGSFALVGTQGGVVYRYNLQSGQPRGAYPSKAFRGKLNYRKIEAGDVRQTVKKMKKATQGRHGALRNASGALVHGKKGVGYTRAGGGGGDDDPEDSDDEDEEGEEEEEGGQQKKEEEEGASAAKQGRKRKKAKAEKAAAEALREDAQEAAFAKSLESAHTAAVTGVGVDALNHTLVTASLDGTLRFWAFQAQSLSIRRIATTVAGEQKLVYHRSDAIKQVGSPVGLMELVRDSGLVACGCDDKAIRVFDIGARRLVRRLTPSHGSPSSSSALTSSSPHRRSLGPFGAGGGALTDLAFSPDARRLYSASQDSTLRVWDLPSGKCVDWVAFSPSVAAAFKKPLPKTKKKAQLTGSGHNDDDEAEDEEEDSSDSDSSSSEEEDEGYGLGAATSVSVCPTGEFVCTAHAGERGLHLWSDRSLYENVRLDREPVRPTLVSAPHSSVDQHDPGAKAAKGKALATAAAAAAGGGCGFFLDTTGGGSSGSGGKPGQAQGASEFGWGSEESGGESEEEDGASSLSSKQWSSPAHPLDSSFSSSSSSSASRLVTLSGVPRSRWEALFNLDLVKARNRPIAPVAAPPAAPFFLPTLRSSENGLDPTFGSHSAAAGTTSFAAVAAANQPPPPPPPPQEQVGDSKAEADDDNGEAMVAGWGDAWSDDDGDMMGGEGGEEEEEEEDDEDGGSRIAERAVAAAVASGEDAGKAAVLNGGSRLLRRTKPLEVSRCKLAELLTAETNEEEDDDEEEDRVLEFLKTLSPSGVDVEVSALCRGGEVEDTAGLGLLTAFLKWSSRGLEKGTSFELFQAYLHRTLHVHAEVIASDPAGPTGALAEAVREACTTQQKASARVRDLLQQNLCLTQFFSNIQPF